MHAHFVWVHAHFFHTLKNPPFLPSLPNSLRITFDINGLIPSPTFLDRNSNALFSLVLLVWNSVHCVHSVYAVCTCLTPNVGLRTLSQQEYFQAGFGQGYSGHLGLLPKQRGIGYWDRMYVGTLCTRLCHYWDEYAGVCAGVRLGRCSWAASVVHSEWGVLARPLANQ